MIASHTNPSKFVLVPSVWNQLKIREICMGQYQTFILYISSGKYNWEAIFGKGPFLRTLYLKMAPNPIISQIYFFVTSHFGTLFQFSFFSTKMNYELSDIKKVNQLSWRFLSEVNVPSIHWWLIDVFSKLYWMGTLYWTNVNSKATCPISLKRQICCTVDRLTNL